MPPRKITHLELIIDYYFNHISPVMEKENWEMVKLFKWDKIEAKPIIDATVLPVKYHDILRLAKNLGRLDSK